jgi:hypothetical protein
MTHPETLDGEVFMFNATDEGYQNSVWRTRRMGHQAYDMWGAKIRNVHPVFVKRTEIEEAGLDPDQFEKNRERYREECRDINRASILEPPFPLPES